MAKISKDCLELKKVIEVTTSLWDVLKKDSYIPNNEQLKEITNILNSNKFNKNSSVRKVLEIKKKLKQIYDVSQMFRSAWDAEAFDVKLINHSVSSLNTLFKQLSNSTSIDDTIKVLSDFWLKQDDIMGMKSDLIYSMYDSLSREDKVLFDINWILWYYKSWEKIEWYTKQINQLVNIYTNKNPQIWKKIRKLLPKRKDKFVDLVWQDIYTEWFKWYVKELKSISNKITDVKYLKKKLLKKWVDDDISKAELKRLDTLIEKHTKKANKISKKVQNNISDNTARISKDKLMKSFNKRKLYTQYWEWTSTFEKYWIKRPNIVYNWNKTILSIGKPSVNAKGVDDFTYKKLLKSFLKPEYNWRIPSIYKTADDIKNAVKTFYDNVVDKSWKAVDVKVVEVRDNVLDITIGKNTVYLDLSKPDEAMANLNFLSKQAMLEPNIKQFFWIKTFNPDTPDEQVVSEVMTNFYKNMSDVEKQMLIEDVEDWTNILLDHYLTKIWQPLNEVNYNGILNKFNAFFLPNHIYLKEYSPDFYKRFKYLSNKMWILKNTEAVKMEKFYINNKPKISEFSKFFDENKDFFHIYEYMKRYHKVSADDISDLYTVYKGAAADWKNVTEILELILPEYSKYKKLDIPLWKFSDMLERFTKREKWLQNSSFYTTMAWYRNKEWLGNVIPTTELKWIWDLEKFIEDYVWEWGKYEKIFYDMYKNIDWIPPQDIKAYEISDWLRKQLLNWGSYSISRFNENLYSKMDSASNLDWVVSWMKSHWWSQYMKNLMKLDWVPDNVVNRIYWDMIKWESLFWKNMYQKFLWKIRWLTYTIKLNVLSPNAWGMAMQDWLTNWVRVYTTTQWWSQAKQRLISGLYKRLHWEAFDDKFKKLFSLDSNASLDQRNILMETTKASATSRFVSFLTKKSTQIEAALEEWVSKGYKWAKEVQYILKKTGVAWLSASKINALQSPLALAPKVLDFFGANTLMYQKVFDESWISTDFFNTLIDWVEDLYKTMNKLKKDETKLTKNVMDMSNRGATDTASFKKAKWELIDVQTRASIAEKEYQRHSDIIYNKLNSIKEEAELDYQRLYSMWIFNGSNRNWFSRLTWLNFFSSWGSKTMWEFLYYGLLKPIWVFKEMTTRYGFGAAMKNMLTELPNNYHLTSLFQWAGMYMRLMHRLWKDEDFAEYTPERKIEYLLGLFKMTPFYQWILSFVGSRALSYGVDDYWKAKDFWLNDWQAVGKWIWTALFHIVGNIYKDVSQTLIKPSSQLIRMYSENKDMSANDWVQFILDYFHDNVRSYTRYALMDSYKWISFKRLDDASWYSFLDMLLWTATKYRWDVDKLIDDSYLALQQSKKPDGNIFDYMWLERNFGNLLGRSTYLTTKLKHWRITKELQWDKNFDNILNWDLTEVSDEMVDYLEKKLAKHSWINSFDKEKDITNDEQWKIAFILNELKNDWLDVDKIMLTMKYGNLKAREKDLASMEMVGATNVAITSLYAYTMKKLLQEEKAQFRKLYNDTMPEDMQTEIKRNLMKKFLPSIIQADKQMHINLADSYIRANYWDTLAWVKELWKWGADSEAMRIYKIGLLAELVDMDKFDFDRDNVKNVFSTLFEKATPEKKWELIIDAFDTIDKIKWVSQNWKVATKAAILYWHIRDLKTLINWEHWDVISSSVTKLSEMIFDVDNATTINPSLLDNLAWLSGRKKVSLSGKKLKNYGKQPSWYNRTNFADIVKNWVSSLRKDIVNNPKLKSLAIDYARKKLSASGTPKMSFEQLSNYLSKKPLWYAKPKSWPVQKSEWKLKSKLTWTAKRWKAVKTKRARKIKQPKVKF